MIFHETTIHQTTVESKLLQVPLRPSTINQSPHHNEICKRSRNINVKLFIKHENLTNLLKKCWTNNNKWLIKQGQPLYSGSIMSCRLNNELRYFRYNIKRGDAVWLSKKQMLTILFMLYKLCRWICIRNSKIPNGQTEIV